MLERRHMTVRGQDLQVHLILQKIGTHASEPRVPTTPDGSAPVGRPSRRFLRQEAMGEEPPPVPRLNRLTQEPDRRTTRLWAPLTPPPPLRARPRNRNNSNNDQAANALLARLPSSDTSLSAQSDDSDMV